MRGDGATILPSLVIGICMPLHLIIYTGCRTTGIIAALALLLARKIRRHGWQRFLYDVFTPAWQREAQVTSPSSLTHRILQPAPPPPVSSKEGVYSMITHTVMRISHDDALLRCPNAHTASDSQ